MRDDAEALRDWLAEGTENLSEAARERVADARRHALDAQVKLKRATRQARERVAETIDDRPVLIGALGFLVGLVAGALLPATRRENETIGAWRDRMFDEAERIFREETRKAARVAQAAAEKGHRVVGEALDRAAERLPTASTSWRRPPTRPAPRQSAWARPRRKRPRGKSWARSAERSSHPDERAARFRPGGPFATALGSLVP